MGTETTQEQAVQAVYEHAASLVKAGKTKPEVEADLKSRGLDDRAANIVATNIFELRARALKEAAKKNMLHGALWCIGGVVVTAVTYQAVAGTGGTYIVAFGPIIFGAIQFFRGLAQSAFPAAGAGRGRG